MIDGRKEDEGCDGDVSGDEGERLRGGGRHRSSWATADQRCGARMIECMAGLELVMVVEYVRDVGLTFGAVVASDPAITHTRMLRLPSAPGACWQVPHQFAPHFLWLDIKSRASSATTDQSRFSKAELQDVEDGSHITNYGLHSLRRLDSHVRSSVISNTHTPI